MKLLKFFLVLTVISFVFSTICVFAQSQVSWSPVELNFGSSIYTSNQYKKNIDYCTGIYKTAASDAFNVNKTRQVDARVSVYHASSDIWSDGNWKKEIPTKEWTFWGYAANDCYAETVKIKLRATNALAKVNFWGVWDLQYVESQ